jgi:hypothetical protein
MRRKWAPWYHVPEVLDHAVRDEHAAAIVPIDAPGVRRSVRDGLEPAPSDVVAPNSTVDRHAVGCRRAGLADQGAREDAVEAVEPAVRSPGETVEDVVLRTKVPSIEHHFGRAIWCVVPIAVRHEEQLRDGAEPDAAEADLDPAQVAAIRQEHFFFVKAAVVVFVREDGDAVLRGFRADGHPVGVGEALDDPEAAALIESESDGLHHVGLAREKRRAKTVGQTERFGSLLGRERGRGGRGRRGGRGGKRGKDRRLPQRKA